MYRFGSGNVGVDYILRTKYGICLSSRNIHIIESSFRPLRTPFYFEDHSEEENRIINLEYTQYYLGKQEWCSRDKTHSHHSKTNTKNRKQARDANIKNSVF